MEKTEKERIYSFKEFVEETSGFYIAVSRQT